MLIRENIPQELRDLNTWLLWKSIPDGPKKPRKVPYYANGGRRFGTQGTDEDRAQLVTFEEVLKTYDHGDYAGIGLALMPEHGLTALDFDGCVTDGKVKPEVLELVQGGYCEISPSGTGVRAFVSGDLGNHQSHLKQWPEFGLDVFSSKGFVTVTGNVAEAGLHSFKAIPAVSPALLEVCARRFGKKVDTKRAPVEAASPTDAELTALLTVISPDCSYDHWLKAGMAIHHATGGEGFAIWNTWSEGGAEYPSYEEAEKKWQSFKKFDGRVITLATLRALAKQLNPEGYKQLGPTLTAVSKFRPQSLEEFLAMPAPSWRIKGVLPSYGVGMVYGASGAGKSFFVLDKVMAIARGVEWRGRKVKEGHVVYVAAEGAGGMAKRIQAYRQHFGIKQLATMKVLSAAPNLHGEEDFAPLLQALKDGVLPDVVVIDTLAQVTAGADENSGQDMGKVFAKLQELQQALNCLVLLVHHAGKNAEKGARGWSGMKAALDVEMEVATGEGGVATAKVTKQKDGESGAKFSFKLTRVWLGDDEDGEPITSCIVEAVEEPVKEVEKAGVWQRAIMKELRAKCTAANPWMKETELVEEVYLAARDGGGTKTTRKDVIKRTLKTMGEDKVVIRLEGKVTLPQLHKPPQIDDCGKMPDQSELPQLSHHPIGVECCGSVEEDADGN